MSKSTHTPNSTTSDQALEPGSNRAVTIPTGPVKIVSSFNKNYFLHFKSADNPFLTVTSVTTAPNSLWVIGPSSLEGEYRIFSYTEPSLRATEPLPPDIHVKVGGGSSWVILDAGSGAVYIQARLTNRVWDLWGGPWEGNRVSLTELVPTFSQKFKIIANPV